VCGRAQAGGRVAGHETEGVDGGKEVAVRAESPDEPIAPHSYAGSHCETRYAAHWFVSVWQSSTKKKTPALFRILHLHVPDKPQAGTAVPGEEIY
jgi:hypothetical protein